MKPPCKWNVDGGFSVCSGCSDWKKTGSFFHDAMWWTLCVDCWEDYWLNTELLHPDYRGLSSCKKCYPVLIRRKDV